MLSDIIKYKTTNGCRDMTDPVGRNSSEFRRWKCQFLSLQQIFFFLFLAWVYHLGVNLTSFKLSYRFESNTVVVANAVINYLELSLYQQQDILEMTAVECLFFFFQIPKSPSDTLLPAVLPVTPLCPSTPMEFTEDSCWQQIALLSQDIPVLD